MQGNVHGNIVDKNKTLETIQMPTDRRMRKLWNFHPTEYQIKYRIQKHTTTSINLLPIMLSKTSKSKKLSVLGCIFIKLKAKQN